MREDFNDLLFIMPEIYLLLLACAMLVYGVFTKKVSASTLSFLVVVSFLLGFYFLIAIVPVKTELIFENLLVSSSAVIFIKGFILFMSTIYALLVSFNAGEENGKVNCYEFPILIIFAVIGMMLLISSNDFITFYLSIELLSITLYVLAALARDDMSSNEAGLKYFVLGAIASGIMLFGISLIYGFAGSVGFEEIKKLYEDGFSHASEVNLAVQVGLIMLISGLLFKVSAAPFHFWTPDVYEGSPTIVTMFFATVPKFAVLYILFHIIHHPFQMWFVLWSQVIYISAILSLIVGSVGALAQSNLKRLMAYSSIAHMGFLLLPVASFGYDKLINISFYFLVYFSMNLGIFSLILSMQKQDVKFVEIKNLSGIAKEYPVRAFSLSLLLFSMAGIPPFGGFFAKYLALAAVIDNQQYAIAVIAVISSVISAFYYIRIIKVMYFDESSNYTASFSKNDYISTFLYFAAFFNLTLFLFLQDIVEIIFKIIFLNV